LVEDTYYSNDPELDVAAAAQRVRGLAAERGLSGAELRQESGVLPILIGGDPEVFWPRHDPIPRLGLRGGFFQATTGYSFGLALQVADELSARAGPWTSAALADWSRTRFARHWREGGYYRMLNRMLFHAGEPDERYQVLSHFYRLPDDLIARFYAGRPTMADKARILSGRPPVPVGAAIAALLGRRR
jgi:lycopene beta-cyclase